MQALSATFFLLSLSHPVSPLRDFTDRRSVEAVESRTLTFHHAWSEASATRIKRSPQDSGGCAIKDVTADQLEKRLESHTWNATFEEDTSDTIVMSYIGGSQSGKILAISEDAFYVGYKVWLSKNFGRTFNDVTKSFEPQEKNDYFVLSPMIHIHPENRDYIYVLGTDSMDESILFVSSDGGERFARRKLPFVLSLDGASGVLDWHPTQPETMLAIDGHQKLYVSWNLGDHWRAVASDVAEAKWSGDSIFLLENTNIFIDFFVRLYTLKKLTNNGQNSQTLAQRVGGSDFRNGVLYASVYELDDTTSRSLHVSQDEGETWHMANLPSLGKGDFYSVLSVDDGMLTVHVNKNNEPEGWGRLYTSDADGIIFSESLPYHAYTEGSLFSSSKTDFYKVRSMRGTFISTVLDEKTRAPRSVITFDRGGEWEDIRVDGGICDTCQFLILNEISTEYNLRPANTPNSQKKATGLVLANAVVYETLGSIPDAPVSFYVSADGGYLWKKAREGEHIYEILDQGGVIVALPITGDKGFANTSTILFSFDEGACWHEHQFSPDPVLVVDILTEPGSLSFHASIWGKVQQDDGRFEWITFIIDFREVFERDCGDDDYTHWTAHELNDDNGCLLGLKEKFKRLKPDSFCRNTDSHLGGVAFDSEHCACTEADYECEYGYVRALDSTKCQPMQSGQIVEKICDASGHMQVFQMKPYRRIAGDVCEGGLQHEEGRVISWDERCRHLESIDDSIQTIDKTSYNKKSSDSKKTSHSGLLLFFILFGIIFVAAGVWLYNRRNIGVSTRMNYKNMDDDDDNLISAGFEPVSSHSAYNGGAYIAPTYAAGQPANSEAEQTGAKKDDGPIIEIDDEPLMA